MREVLNKRKRWREQGAKKDQKFLGKHIIPVVLGPKQRPYVVDHHHLARALQRWRSSLVTTSADLIVTRFGR
jgi:hypothetical protein